MSGEGDLDPTEGHSKLSVGTLSLTAKDPPKNPEGKDPPQDPPKNTEDKGPPQEPSVEEPTSGLPERDKKSGNTPPSEKSKQTVDTPSEYPPQDQPETPIDPGEHLAKPPSPTF